MKYSFIILVISLLVLSACKQKEITSEDLRDYFTNHKVGGASDYAVIKNGTDYLATFHGMADDKSACEDLIKPFNEDASLSVFPGTYSCVRLND